MRALSSLIYVIGLSFMLCGCYASHQQSHNIDYSKLIALPKGYVSPVSQNNFANTQTHYSSPAFDTMSNPTSVSNSGASSLSSPQNLTNPVGRTFDQKVEQPVANMNDFGHNSEYNGSYSSSISFPVAVAIGTSAIAIGGSIALDHIWWWHHPVRHLRRLLDVRRCVPAHHHPHIRCR